MIMTSCPRRASAIPVYRPVGPAPTMTARMPVPLFRRYRDGNGHAAGHRMTATPASGQASHPLNHTEEKAWTPDTPALHGRRSGSVSVETISPSGFGLVIVVYQARNRSP